MTYEKACPHCGGEEYTEKNENMAAAVGREAEACGCDAVEHSTGGSACCGDAVESGAGGSNCCGDTEHSCCGKKQDMP